MDFRDRILNIDINEIIGKHISLRKQGANYQACCPFHNEKTPSFVVSPAKGKFKCFGCGEGGNAIDFVMKYLNMDFITACREIGKSYNIEVVTREKTPEENEAERQIESIEIVNALVAKWFVNNLTGEASAYASARWNENTIKEWSIGYAPKEWNALGNWAKEQGIKTEILLKAGLLKENKEGKIYDFFRGRLIIPIPNRYGKITGFTGRLLTEQKDQPKYINTQENELYKKGDLLFGIDKAYRTIKEKDCVYLVEGNPDVLRMHEIGILNTVCPGGTGLTKKQIDTLKNLCKSVNIIGDSDEAGKKAASRNAELIIKSGLYVNIVSLPEGEKADPDSFFIDNQQAKEYITENITDYIVHTARVLKDKCKNPDFKMRAIDKLSELIACYPEPMRQQLYIDQVSKLIGPKKAIDQKVKELSQLNTEATSDEPVNIPDHIDKEDFEKYGFYVEDNRYHFLGKEGLVTASNFVLNPLFHIYSKSDNKRLIEIVNEHNYKKIVDIPSKSFVSFEQFQQLVYQEGNYLFFGNKFQFMKILSKISNDFPVCNELKTLGWQREGFYAFSNGIYNGAWQPVDEYGITNHAGDSFFSPAFSKVYSGVREDDDEYENDRYFIYQQSSYTFTQWATLFRNVYGEDKGMIGIAYLVAAIFRDLIYEKYKIFPHLFLFGEKQSGKSQFGWSLSNVFLNGQPAFNLSSGTNVGFFRKLARFRNSIVWYDEYTNDIDEKRFQALKAAYDGVGHEKGKMTKDNRTEITKVNAASAISGQYLPTRDDNALFTRSIMLAFSKRTYSREEMADFDELKKAEEGGLSSIITEILPFRELIDKRFGREFSEIFDAVKTQMLDEQKVFEERLVRNFVTLLTPIKIIFIRIDT